MKIIIINESIKNIPFWLAILLELHATGLDAAKLLLNFSMFEAYFELRAIAIDGKITQF